MSGQATTKFFNFFVCQISALHYTHLKFALFRSLGLWNKASPFPGSMSQRLQNQALVSFAVVYEMPRKAS